LIKIMSAFDILFGFVWKSAIFVGLAAGVIMVLLYFFQNKLLYIPDAPNRQPSANPEGLRNPGEAGLNYEDVTIVTSDKVKLHGWLVKMPGPQQYYPTIVYFHENAGNIGTRIPFLKYMQKYCNVNILLVAYRGFSYSEGVPTESGLQKDAHAVLNYIFSRTDLDTEKIFVFGRSLGGAVGIYGLSHGDHKAAGLIVENTFTSISDMVDIVFAKLSLVKNLILNIKWHSIENIKSIEIPIFFIMGLKDELIPTVQMLRLYQAAEKARFKEKHEVHHGTHNDTWARDVEEYFKQMRNFIDKCLKQKHTETLTH